jgi:hypothetical protein
LQPAQRVIGDGGRARSGQLVRQVIAERPHAVRGQVAPVVIGICRPAAATGAGAADVNSNSSSPPRPPRESIKYSVPGIPPFVPSGTTARQLRAAPCIF